MNHWTSHSNIRIFEHSLATLDGTGKKVESARKDYPSEGGRGSLPVKQTRERLSGSVCDRPSLPSPHSLTPSFLRSCLFGSGRTSVNLVCKMVMRHFDPPPRAKLRMSCVVQSTSGAATVGAMCQCCDFTQPTAKLNIGPSGILPV